MSTAAAVAGRAAERRIVNALRESGATGSGKPAALVVGRRNERRKLARLIAAGAVVEAEPGRYRLDEEAYEAYRGQRWRRAVTLLALGLGLGSILAFVLRSR